MCKIQRAMLELYLQELLSPLMLHSKSYAALSLITEKILNGQPVNLPDSPKQIYSNRGTLMYSDQPENLSYNPYDEYPNDTIAIIPLSGFMTKYGSWWRTGVDDLANLIRLADKSDKIIGTILLTDSPGGSTSSIFQLEDAMRNRTKACVGLIEGSANSGACYAVSFCDVIGAINPMCEIGSIGVMARFMDYSKADEKYGIKTIEVYPPESKYKNLESREAIEGDTKRLIEEQLTPFAIHFQNIIKSNRPNLDLSIEGIIEGKVFYARDAVKYNLVDKIMNLEQAVAEVQKINDSRKTIYSFN